MSVLGWIHRFAHLGSPRVVLVAACVTSCGQDGPTSARAAPRDHENATGGAGGAAGAESSSSQAGLGGCVINGTSYAAMEVIPLDACNNCTCFGDNRHNCTKVLIVVPLTCDYAGAIWREKEAVPAIGDCNDCTCQTEPSAPCSFQAVMVCSAVECADSCVYAGRSYASGASFSATDGCNRCTCTQGVVDCSKDACNCHIDQAWRWYQLTDAALCTTKQLDCPTGTTPFSNDCGCGCEQSPDCPMFARCSNAAGAAASPFSIPNLSPQCALPTVCPLSVRQVIL